MARPSSADKRKTFRELHQSGCFVIPNPWNIGSARYLQGLGFKALASTSAGFSSSISSIVSWHRPQFFLTPQRA